MFLYACIYKDAIHRLLARIIAESADGLAELRGERSLKSLRVSTYIQICRCMYGSIYIYVYISVHYVYLSMFLADGLAKRRGKGNGG